MQKNYQDLSDKVDDADLDLSDGSILGNSAVICRTTEFVLAFVQWISRSSVYGETKSSDANAKQLSAGAIRGLCRRR
jgi:hypothetical protein